VKGLPSGWAQATLDDIADVMDFERQPINSSERESRVSGKSDADLFPYYGATGQVGLIDSFRSEGQRVLLGEDAAPFLDQFKDKAYLANGRFWVNNHAHVLAGAAGLIDNKFLCHQLNTVDYHPFVTGSTRLKLTSSAMKQIPMAVAPVAEQIRIVAKLEELLSDLDAAVAELKAAQRKLGQYRQSLLKAAFEGALTAEWRANNHISETGAQLLERILQERRAFWEAKQLAKFAEQGKRPPKDWQKKYPEPVQPDIPGLPELPESWIWGSLDMLITDGPQNGVYLPGDRYGQGVPILRIDDYQIGWHRARATLNLVDANDAIRQTYSLAKGDLVINRVNSMTHLGKSLLITDLLTGVLFESNMMRFSLSEFICDEFVALYLGAGVGRARLIQDAKWAVNQASINQQDVRRTPVPIAPAAEQIATAVILKDQLESADQQGVAIDQALKQSTAQRQNILRTAFSGELVSQNPSDEPASILLERIRAAKLELKKPSSHKAKVSA